MPKELPLTNDGGQKFRSTLAGATYDIFVSWNSRMEIWTMDISLNNVELASGIALLSGVDITKPFTINLNNMYVVNIDNVNEPATAENLGDSVLVVRFTDSEVAALV